MHFDLKTLTPRECHKLLTGVIVPRPIALVTSRDAGGRVNAAPFSYFNLMGYDPPVVVFGPSNRPDGSPKDTARQVHETGEFVVNIVDEALAEQMNITSGSYPPGVNELDVAGLTTRPSVEVDPPCIDEAPANLECKVATILYVGHTRIVVGEVLHFHIRDDLVDPEKLYIDTEKLKAVGRMHGGGWYTRTSDLFKLDRPIVDPRDYEPVRRDGT